MDTPEDKKPEVRQAPDAEKAQAVSLDPKKVEAYLQEVRDTQNLGAGIVVGLAAAVTGAVIWALATAITGWQIGWMAVGVGFLVGFAVRFAGRGVDPSFGVAGAILSLFGCLLGNLLAIYMLAAQHYDESFFTLLFNSSPGDWVNVIKESFHGMDLLFYGIAVYEGYRFSFRQITKEELAKIKSS